MAKDSKKKKIDKIKSNLNNCKTNCDNSCKKRIRDENPEICVLRCQLACTTNSLNQLMK